MKQIKDLSVLLKRESFIERRHGNRDKNTGHGDKNTVVSSCRSENNLKLNHYFKYLKEVPITECIRMHNDSKQIINCDKTKNISFTELNKAGQMAYKSNHDFNLECKVILERFDINRALQAKSTMCHINLNPMNDSLISAVLINDALKTGLRQFKNNGKLTSLDVHGDIDMRMMTKHLLSKKLPVYEQITKEKSKINALYEFDESESDQYKIEGVTKGNQHDFKKKKAVSTTSCSTQTNKKKYKFGRGTVKMSRAHNIYDTTVQKILRKVMKKVEKKKFHIENTLTKKQIHKQYNNMRGTVQQYNNKLQMSNDTVEHNCNEDNDKNASEMNNCLYKNRENGIYYENECQNNNLDSGCPKNNKKIHIISDIILENTDNSSFLSCHVQPNTNSTILFTKNSSPWRFTENLKRNPHYLNIKKTGLPSLQQAMVIDHTQMKKMEHFSKNLKQIDHFSNKSASVDDLQHSCDTSDKENIPHSNIFDTEDFITDDTKLEQHIAKSKQKDNILGPQVQNVLNIINDINVSENKTLKTRAFFRQVLQEKSNMNKLDVILGSSVRISENNSINSNLGPKLFEDDQPKIKFSENYQIYAPKIRKKRKLLSDNMEKSSQDKLKKDMTKTEEAELEQWAARFNSLCEDIENHKLEIE